MIIIELPFRLPLWNVIIRMHHAKQTNLKRWLHGCASALKATDNESMTQTTYRLNSSWMVLYGAEYYKMIAVTKSKKSRLKAISAKKKRQLLKSRK